MEKDTQITLYGVFSSLHKSYYNKRIYSQTNKINVSPLIRTWMTALCLYLPYHKTIKLTVTPFLMEHYIHDKIDTNNYPNNFKKQIKNLGQFMLNISYLSDFVKNMSNKKVINQLNKMNDYTQINVHYNSGKKLYIGVIKKYSYGIKCMIKVDNSIKYQKKFTYDEISSDYYSKVYLNSLLENVSELPSKELTFDKNDDLYNNKNVLKLYFGIPPIKLTYKFSRWCEPFSHKKKFSLKNKKCKY